MFWGADHEEVALRLDSHWRSGELCEVWEKGGHACSGADRELERDQQGSASLAALRDACTSKASLGRPRSTQVRDALFETEQRTNSQCGIKKLVNDVHSWEAVTGSVLEMCLASSHLLYTVGTGVAQRRNCSAISELQREELENS